MRACADSRRNFWTTDLKFPVQGLQAASVGTYHGSLFSLQSLEANKLFAVGPSFVETAVKLASQSSHIVDMIQFAFLPFRMAIGVAGIISSP